MKSKMTNKVWLIGMTTVGLVSLVAGLVMRQCYLGQEGLMMRMAGFLSGLGTTLTLMGGLGLIVPILRGEAKTRESELHMEDERGLMVAYRAQNIAAVAAVLCIVAVMMVALVRGDHLYMFLLTAACLIVAAVKMVAWYVYDRNM